MSVVYYPDALTYEDLDFTIQAINKVSKHFKIKKRPKGSFLICNEISLENELLS
jgi:hypothetical protein